VRTASARPGAADLIILKVSETENTASARGPQALSDKYEYDVLTQLMEESCR
jgi:hypothetical protein